MKLRKIIALLICFCLVWEVLPVQASAAEVDVPEVDLQAAEEALSLGEVDGYLYGNALTTANLFVERKFTGGDGGHGFAAERGNNLIDKLLR